MTYNSPRFAVLLLFIFLSCIHSVAQVNQPKPIKNRLDKTKLFAELKEYEKIIAQCEEESHESQMSKFGKILPKVSGHYWEGCATKIVLPYYPREAKRLRITGQVKVETIVDETGKVIYAQITKGNLLLGQAARRAAYYSTYTPKKDCKNKPVKFRWTITYNFIF